MTQKSAVLNSIPCLVNFPGMLNYFVVIRCRTAEVLACVGQVLLRLALGE
jgi:hypothetical protein